MHGSCKNVNNFGGMFKEVWCSFGVTFCQLSFFACLVNLCLLFMHLFGDQGHSAGSLIYVVACSCSFDLRKMLGVRY